MDEQSRVTEILRDLSVLYELSLAVGRSLELHENCDEFLRKVMARKSLAFASVWVRASQVPGAEDDAPGYRQVYANPAFRAPLASIGDDHPLVARVMREPSFSVAFGDAAFEDVVTEQGVDGGAFAIYRLGTTGFLKLYAIARPTAFSAIELSKLRHVVDQFAVSVDGCLDHARVRAAETRRRALERQMLQAQKLEGLGLLAGGIAHDFNNLLSVILGSVELARAGTDANGDAELDNVEEAASRAADLCSQLLAYAGGAHLATAIVDLSEVVLETMRLTAVTVSKKARMQQRLAQHLPAIEADRTQLLQVVMNLVTNASEALDEATGEVAVATGSIRVTARDLEGYHLGEARRPGEYVYLDVIDNGCGIDAATRERLFDPFFTTKFTGRGLGLAAVLGIVRSHRGAIRVASTPGQGTRVRVLFPAVNAEQPEPRAPLGTRADTARRGTILIVDDEDSVRRTLGRLVEAEGLDALVAAHGGEAVDVFRQRWREIDVVLLDLTMPVMGGEEAFAAMLEIDPRARVILMSGYTHLEGERLTNPRPAAFLAKPIRSRDLFDAIGQLLDERGTSRAR